MRYGSSQLAENLPSFFLALLAILHTRSPTTNDRGCRFALYFLVAHCLAARLRIWAFSLSSGRRLRCKAMFWWLWVGSYSSRRRDGLPISTSIMASAP